MFEVLAFLTGMVLLAGEINEKEALKAQIAQQEAAVEATE